MREIQISTDGFQRRTDTDYCAAVTGGDIIIGILHPVPGHQLQLAATENIFNLNFHLTIFCTEVQKVTFNSCFPWLTFDKVEDEMERTVKGFWLWEEKSEFQM